MTITFDISCDTQFYNIKCSVNALNGHSLAEEQEHISKLCIEFIRLIREDTKKYNINKRIKLNDIEKNLFTTLATSQGFNRLKSFLKDDNFILYDVNTSNDNVSYIKTLSLAEVSFFYKKIEEFRCATAIKLITDIC